MASMNDGIPLSYPPPCSAPRTLRITPTPPGVWSATARPTSATTTIRTMTNVRLLMLCPRGWTALHRGCPVQLEHAVAVAESLQLRHTQRVQYTEHHVGERRRVRRFEVKTACNRAAGMTGDEERHPLVVVQVRIAHRRPIQDHA